MAQAKARYWFKARYTIGEALDELPDDEAGTICKAIWHFAEHGEEPEEIPQKLRPLWKVFRADLIQDDIDRANGAKGGNPAFLHPTPVQGGLNPGSRGVEQGLPKEDKDKDKEKESDIDIGASNEANQPTETQPTANPTPDTEKASTKKRVRFIEPTVEEVRQYFQEIHFEEDPEYFIDYYQTRGWELKPGQKVKDWKACARTWKKNSQKGGGRNGISGTRPKDQDPRQRDDYEF